MKTFREFLQNQDTGLIPNRNLPVVQHWQATDGEILRNINTTVIKCLDTMPKIHNFGIEDIKFDIMQKENIRLGTKLKLEAFGKTVAKNQEYIILQLEKLMQSAKLPLKEKGIYLSMLYDKLDAHEVEMNNKYEFTILCNAILIQPS